MAAAPEKKTRGRPSKEPAKLKAAPAPKKTRAKRGQAKTPTAQKSLLQRVLEDDPNITSEQFAVKFNLPVEEVARHRAFVLQYLLDYNTKNAALRMGYPEETAYQTGRQMLNYSYSQLFLSELQRAKTVEAVITQGQLASKVLEELNRPDTVINGCCTTNSATRLTAAKLLAQMLGLLNPKPKEQVITVQRIMYVGNPELKSAGSNIEEWGAVAKTSQKRLKEQTSIDV